MDIIVLADFSTSIAGSENFVIDAIHDFVDQFELSEEGINIAVIVFNNDGYLISHLTSRKDSLKIKIKQLNSIQLIASTDMYSGLSDSFAEFTINGRSDYKKLLIVISDGAVNAPIPTFFLAEEIKKSKIGICSIMISDSSSNPTFMKSISSDCYLETDYRNLIKELKKLDICI